MASEVGERPADQNAQAAEDAQKLLDELQNEKATESSEQKADEVGTDATAEKGSSNSREDQDKPRESRNGHRGGHRGRGGGRGRGGYNRPMGRENIKSDLTTQEVSSDPVAIRKQVEFYFSDSNLPMDKFLLEKVGGSKNNPVELSILHSFKRMRHFQPLEAIVTALKDSDFLELTDDNTAVKRKEPLPGALDDGPEENAVKVFEDKAMPRSVYVKGFGEEQPSTQFDIEAFFAPYGPTNAIRLRRTDDKLFKRSVFVEFESEELAQKFLELDPKPKYKGKDLLIMSKKEYCDQKVEDIKSGKIKPNHRHGQGGYKSRGGGRDFKRKRDDEDDRDWRQRREEDRKNGFKDDRRRGGRDRDGRGRNGREENEKDDRGIPITKSTKDSQREEALARARAVVEQENQKDRSGGNYEPEPIEQSEGSVSKKRTREDAEEDTARETKKQDVKTDS